MTFKSAATFCKISTLTLKLNSEITPNIENRAVDFMLTIFITHTCLLSTAVEC